MRYLLLAILTILLPAASFAAALRPNIVVILADDMGFSDIGPYGGEISTPNLDSLAAGGLRFTQFYNTGRCCPTRAALLTGLHQHQAGVGHMTGNRGYPEYQGFLNKRCVTIAEALKPAGYTTMATGKWHVGAGDGQWPLDRGFDKFYGCPQGGGFYFKKREGRDIVLHDKPVEVPAGWYTTDAFNDYAARFIGEAAKEKRPFFLYIAHIAPHWPLQARDEDIAKYRGKYLKGWDQLREERYSRLVESGIVDKSWRLSPRDPGSKSWSDEKRKEELDSRMAIYAAQIEVLDRGIGRVLDALKRSGQWENTLVLFLSDNGASAEGGLRGFSRGKKGAPIGSADSYASYGLGWANASNTPFRRYKSKVHEGGIATPLIAHWPRGIRRKGQLERTPGHVIDILPTCLELAGVPYPEEVSGKPIVPLEGRSLVSAFRGEKSTPRALFWEHQGDRAARRGRWKIVSSWTKGSEAPWELYDLEADRTELENLAGKRPKLVVDLEKEWKSWAARAGVRKWPARRPRQKP